jgi:hypothetical protein
LGAIFGHDGGSVDALHELRSLRTVFNIDADRVSGPFYRSSARQAPHNEYTSTQRLRQYAQANGDGGGSSRMTIPHKDDVPSNDRPSTFSLQIQFSYGDYTVQWRYDHGANDYLRSMGGSPHVEATTGKQITAKNVVVMMTNESPDVGANAPGTINMRTQGTGKATVYLDGKAIVGTWSKPSIDAPVQWLDADGKPIALNRGTTWVEVVPIGNSVTASGG